MPIPLVIDTDPGIDDAVALLLAAASPEVDLRAVTAVFGNVPLELTAANAARLLALAGRPDVPVAAGADRPLVHPQAERAEGWHGDDGLGGRAGTLPDAARPLDPRPAVEVLADVLRTASEPVTICPIGAFTNVALLLATHPELKPRIGRIVAMGGSLGGGNTTAAAEFNVYADPEAAHRVLTEPGVDVTLVPLDLTLRCAVGREWLDTLRSSSEAGAVLAGIVDHYADEYERFYGRYEVALHDATCLAEAIRPGLLRTTTLPITVITDLGPARGLTLADRRLEAPGEAARVQVALDADVDEVRAFVLDRLTGGAT